MLAATATGSIGERVIAHVERFGRAEGEITRVMERGFIMSIAASDEERAKLAAKILWLEDHKNHDQAEGRKHGRIVPRDPLSRLTFGDGTRLTCLVIDMSVSGAAVSADIVPELGMPLAVGKVPGIVVRRFSEGFAVQCIDAQDARTLEQMVTKP